MNKENLERVLRELITEQSAGVWPEKLIELDVRVVAERIRSAIETGIPATGWMYFSPDSGTEYSEQHPIESGEVPDAEDVRPATAENLLEELLSSWKAWGEDRQELQRLREAASPDVRREALDLSVLERLAKVADNYDEPDENGPFPDIQDAMITVGDLRKIRKLLRALSAKPAPSEDTTERGKFYHKHWPTEKLLEARRGGLVDHSGGEAWRYEYTHKDENGEYDMLYRRVAPKHKVVTPPEGGQPND